MKSLRKLYKQDYFPIIAYSLLIIFLHLFLSVGAGDDKFHQDALSRQSLLAFLTNQYYNINTRLITEGTMVCVLHIGIWLWKLIDILMLVLAAYSISLLTGARSKRNLNWLIIALMLIYPFNDMSTAGWASTTVNYIWTLSLGLYSLTSIKQVHDGKNINWIHLALYGLATLYAANMEPVCLILVAFYAIAILYSFKKAHKTHTVFIINVLVCIADLIFIVTTPAFKNRRINEVAWSYPEYKMLTLMDKLTMGITTTLSRCIARPNLIFIILCIFILIAVFHEYQDNFYRLIAAIPFATSVFGLFENDIFKNSTGIREVFFYEDPLTKMCDFPPINAVNFSNPIAYLPIVLCVIVLGSLAISIYLIYKNTKETILLILILAAGFCSRFIMAFSPSIYMSSTRTYLYFYFSMILCIVVVYKRIASYVKTVYIKYSLGFLSFLCYSDVILKACLKK